MTQWWKELALVGALGALTGAWLPRVALPRLAFARHLAARQITPSGALEAHSVALQPESLPQARAERAPLPGEISLVEPDQPDEARSATPSLNPPPPTAAAIRARSRREPSSAQHLPGILTRRADRWQLDLRNIPRPLQLMSSVRMVPTGGNSTNDGYRLVSSDRIGLFNAVGIRPGDVLVAVNEAPVRNPDDVLEVLARSRRETRFAFRFHRGARIYTIPVDILRQTDHADVQ